MKTKIVFFIIPVLLLFYATGCGSISSTIPFVPQKNAAVSGNHSPDDNSDKDSNTANFVSHNTNHDTETDTISEIMPAWPPVHDYNKERINMKQRTYITPNTKVAYLTLDDGPSPNTPKILEVLKAKNVKVTFFDVGLQIKKYPEYLKMEYNDGHAIGNHTWDHVYANIYRSPDTLLDEATRTNDLIEQIIGIRTPLFRAPGGTVGNFNVGSWNIMDANNYIVYDWNVSSGDGSAGLMPKQKLVENVLNQSRNKTNAIILIHDSEAKPTSLQALPDIIDGLAKEGFTFGILSPDVQPAQFMQGYLQAANPKPATTTANKAK